MKECKPISDDERTMLKKVSFLTHQDLYGRWLDGDVVWVKVSLLDVFHSLYVNVQNTDEVLCLYVFDGRLAVDLKATLHFLMWV